MSHTERILLVDDDDSLRRVTRYHLEAAGYRVQTASSGEKALEQIDSGHSISLMITDVRMSGMDGLELLKRVHQRRPEIAVVVITAHGSIEDAVQAMRTGAHDYLVKPFEHDALLLSVERALGLTALMRENERLRALAGELLQFENLVATSDTMREVLETASRVAARDTTVLLLGESGTGKELLARAIHNASPRRSRPFVAVNVGALSDTLIDSELFGHRKGAFTGAIGARKGRFEAADGGTLFLDEIGDLRPDLQVKLLRVLQEGEIEPIGANKPVAVNVRIVAATHRDLEAMVERGEFREDLFYRLAVVPLHVPPLRRRRDDILPLVRHFSQRLATTHGEAVPDFDADAIAALGRYAWPGNVRELQNVVERAMALHRTGSIKLSDLPERLQGESSAKTGLLSHLPDGGIDLGALEREIFERALEKCGGNQSATARYLNITRNTLIYRLEKYGLR